MSLVIETKPKKIHANEIGDGKPHPGRRMTEAEFVEWCDDVTRAEWVDGEVIIMDSANEEHDQVHGSVRSGMGALAQDHDLGRVLGDNFQIRLPTQKSRRVPDVLFVTKNRLHIVKHTVCDGAPDLVLEIVSPDSTDRDLRDKFREYEKAGVREYWIINPLAKTIRAYELGGGKTYKEIAESDGKLASKVMKGFFLRRAWILRETFPGITELLKEMKLVK